MSTATETAQQQTHQVCTKPAGANATSWNSHTIIVFRIVKSIDKIKKARRIQSSLSLAETSTLGSWSFTIPRLYVLKMISCRVQQSGKPAINSRHFNHCCLWSLDVWYELRRQYCYIPNIHNRENYQESYPGKLAFCTQLWRFGSDSFLFQLGEILRFHSLILRSLCKSQLHQPDFLASLKVLPE